MASSPRADVIVVGGGTAGSVVAARLSEDPARTVLLLEAGPVSLPQPASLLDATTIPGARGAASWQFPGAIAAGRDWMHPRGRVIGGSSTTNGGYFIPPGRSDVEVWTAHGGAEWAWDVVRPVQRAIERDLDFPASPEHGHAGPVPVSRISADDPLVSAFQASADAAGLPVGLDKGADWSDGFGVTPSNRRGRRRVNAALAYLAPAAGRPNLRVLGDALVLRVEIVGHRATGVVVATGDGVQRFEADEVILAAGVLRSPDLLSLSGVALPGLGDGLHDDPQLVLDVAGWPGASRQAETWLGGVVHATLPDGAGVEILQSLQPLSRIAGQADDDSEAPTPLFVSTGSDGPAGRLVRHTDDPAALPRVELDYLATDASRARLRAAARYAVETVRAGGARVVNLDAQTLTDDRRLDGWVRANLSTAFHTTGGAPLGSIVDGQGRVHDIEGLRVADLSILPAGLRRGPAAAAVLIGELIARPCRADRPYRDDGTETSPSVREKFSGM